ncbi:uncharacterized protein B0I36DRAFT_316298 [Microdochium trichocladiopsis]|uniref:Uncharacterized protein n=1 Tax=Microdochium trichocladiopsis TaxID=1682393 RepID=A0A9P8YI91_9PEZI|nr:uncharacterized protein B0I36DRAFT_316149 [Microdochium trichocladiopsis]XP_046017535.1 uncharacterized protein B0I36DRAFT_316180 [Microdochium trichocladiopsis]XP_046017536.1 uncharacterized protein B0I36DRAFT_316181 [Microdochium trichocladiopsis]XP_046017560.1 uncharacterized protein B0I36DRAFT_316258 [Microdochium trichocladiopsis]XP_046017571.1 uncharacterized protein B0I36DRAFT_316298 [Microdochium trichocladiopsis]KAH7038407.1 hypothetical protein B0I36DRAFT_316149 [Microdochium tric
MVWEKDAGAEETSPEPREVGRHFVGLTQRVWDRLEQVEKGDPAVRSGVLGELQAMLDHVSALCAQPGSECVSSSAERLLSTSLLRWARDHEWALDSRPGVSIPLDREAMYRDFLVCTAAYTLSAMTMVEQRGVTEADLLGERVAGVLRGGSSSCPGCWRHSSSDPVGRLEDLRHLFDAHCTQRQWHLASMAYALMTIRMVAKILHSTEVEAGAGLLFRWLHRSTTGAQMACTKNQAGSLPTV